MSFSINDYDYSLPSELIAQTPAQRRDASRLMVVNRAGAGGAFEHRRFSDLPAILRPGDLLVVNDTQVIPARFFCRRASGGRVEGLFLREQAAGVWQVMLRNAGRCKAGERLTLEGPGDAATSADRRETASLELRENLGQGEWLAAALPATPAIEILRRFGTTPLPPYIRRANMGTETRDTGCGTSDSEVSSPMPSPDSQVPSLDRDRYQTVYAEKPGAVAAPTAGLHFTPELIEQLAARSISMARVTLHVGPGTFLPVKVDDIREHRMHSEWYEFPQAAADAVNAARSEGRRVVAVGTTSVRVLETVAERQTRRQGEEEKGRNSEEGHEGLSPFLPLSSSPLLPSSGWTDIFIHPPHEFRVADAIITNFHLPRSTLLMLVSAFCSPGGTAGIRIMLDAYAEAIREKYRFYSYGDAMLIQ